MLKQREKKILFIGCVESSRILLQRLLDVNQPVAGVITKQSSDFNTDFADLHGICEMHRLPCFFANNINDADCIGFAKNLGADIAFCFGWSQLLKAELINLFPDGVVGFHPAALPANKGRHPLIWALVLGLAETASTFFMIDEQADHGEIVSQRPVSITYEDDAASLYDKIMTAAVSQELEICRKWQEGKLLDGAIANTGGNSWRKRGRLDGQIDWRMSSRAIYNLVRGLTHPYVGAHFIYKEQEYKVWRVQELPEFKQGCDNIEPGKVLRVDTDGSFVVKVYDGAVRITESAPVSLREGGYL